jgi:hypothetical protein
MNEPLIYKRAMNLQISKVGGGGESILVDSHVELATPKIAKLKKAAMTAKISKMLPPTITPNLRSQQPKQQVADILQVENKLCLNITYICVLVSTAGF